MMGVPANYLFMSEEPRFADADLSSLRLAVVGGAPMPVALLDVWAERGVEIVQGYGLTEAAPNVLCLQSEDARRKAGSAGRPYPYVDCRLSGEGELLVRGPERLPRLLAQPGGDRRGLPRRLAADRRLAERDDEGDYWIRGRLKELVVSGGENVYPAEIEAVLQQHDAVVEAAVVGVPDERWGEACSAFVVCRAPVAEDELREFCRVPPGALQGAEVVPPRRRAAAQRRRQGRQGRAGPDGGERMTEVVTSAAGRPLSQRGLDTRRRLLDAAEQVFSEFGYHDASIVKLTETAGVAQGTFYLYFDSKKTIFDELVRDLNSRVRHAMKEGSSRAATRVEQELLGFQEFFRFTAEHPALYRIIRQAEFVSPEMLQYHYERLSQGYIDALQGGRRLRRDRRSRSGGDGVGPDGPRRADRPALDPLERRDRRAGRRSRRARAHRQLDPRAERVRRVGLQATASYLPERWLTAAEIGERAGIPEAVLVEKFGLRGKHIAAEDEHVSDLAVRAASGCSRRPASTRARSTPSSTSGRCGRTGGSGRPHPGSHIGWVAARAFALEYDNVSHGSPIALRLVRDLLRAEPELATCVDGRRLPGVVSARLRERAIAVHVQLRRRRGRGARRRRARRGTRCSARTRSPTGRSRST